MSPYPSCSSVGVKSSATDQDRTDSKCVRAHVVTSSRIIKNDAAVNLPQNKGLGAVPAIAAAAACSISTRQPRMVDRTAGCDRTFKSRYRFGASNSRWVFSDACDQHDRLFGEWARLRIVNAAPWSLHTVHHDCCHTRRP